MNGDTRSNATDPIDRLRLSMNAVVDQHHPPADAWGSIREGVKHGGTRPAPLPAPRRPASLRLLAAAAVLLVVCAGVAVAAKRDGPTHLTCADLACGRLARLENISGSQSGCDHITYGSIDRIRSLV